MTSPDETSSGPFAAAAAIVQKRTGLVFRAARQAAFAGALMRAVERSRADGLDTYLEGLASTPSLFDDLVAEVTVGESYFFREPQALALLQERILPELVRQRPVGYGLRLWSAGCAGGEEPGTLAIMAQQLGMTPAPLILGTDLSRAALARAARGRYRPWSLRGLSDGVVGRYFRREGSTYRLIPDLHQAISWRQLNLVEDGYPSVGDGTWGMDLILCRNVLIYFDVNTATQVVARLAECLVEGGWLVLGASDPLVRLPPQLEAVPTEAGIMYRRRPRGAIAPRVPVAPARTARVLEPPVGTPAGRATGPWDSASRASVEPGVPSLLETAVAQYEGRQYAAAVSTAERLVASEPGNPRGWVILVRALANGGDLGQAGRHCATARERHRDSTELLCLHAILLAAAGHHVAAARAAQSALYLDRHLAVAHATLGASRACLGDREGARRAFRNAEQALARQPIGEPVPLFDGETRERLSQMIRGHLRLLEVVEP